MYFYRYFYFLALRKIWSKLLLIILLIIVFHSCSTTKRVPENYHLLTENTIVKNSKKDNSQALNALLFQQPNSKLFGFYGRLHLFNLAKVNPDSSYQNWLARHPKTESFLNALLSKKQTQRIGSSFLVAGLSNMAKSFGEAPVLYDKEKTKKTATRIKNYYFNQGYFKVKVDYKVDTTLYKKARVTYNISTDKPYTVDSLSSRIESEKLIPLYKSSNMFSLLKKGMTYNASLLDKERDRITGFFRNNGAYDFQKTYITYEIDTLLTPYKAQVNLVIGNKNIKQGDTIATEPFKLYTINKVSIIVAPEAGQKKQMTDSITSEGIKIFSKGLLKYKKKMLSAASYIKPKSTFSDYTRNMTSQSFGNLKIFNYPSIEYTKEPSDSTGTQLNASILLIPKKKFVFSPSIDVTHSNIQQIGTEATLGMTFRNVFRGAEVLVLGVRGNIGSSASKYRNDQNNFFDILEYGADLKLSFPRFVFFSAPDRIIPRRMFPTTNISLAYTSQKNIGLDKQNLSSIYNYSWTANRKNSFSFDVLNLQYVQNLNPGNYFNVYKSSYDILNTIAQKTTTNPDYKNSNGNLFIGQNGTDAFIEDVLNRKTPIESNSEEYRTIRSISERKIRLSENNLILSSNLTFTRSTRFNLKDNEFYSLKLKVESAGNFMSLLSKIKYGNQKSEGNRTFFDVVFSQYIKKEVDYIKYFDLGNKQVLALRAFGGIAIPYGNARSIPFSRSYFAGGSNDNRAWQAYRLGPGSSGGTNDFNEANMKLAFSAEYRFNVAGPWNLAIFADAGNIWNALDQVDDPKMKFKGASSLKDLALGTGFGLRYDFNFFLIRLDVGFKTYNPAKSSDKKWFSEYNFNQAVFNVGINYPF